MQNQINLSPISQFAQMLRASELSQSKELKMPIQQARLLNMALVEILDRLNQDYETMYNALKNSINTEVVSVSMDGGAFSDK
jgi:hypothetical protein